MKNEPMGSNSFDRNPQQEADRTSTSLMSRQPEKRWRWLARAASALVAVLLLGSLTACSLYPGLSVRHTEITRLSAAPTATATRTVTPLANTCFLDPSGPSIPAVYANNTTLTAGPATAPGLKGTPVSLGDGLLYADIKQGSGPTVEKGSQVTVNYTGWLASNCKEFDSSYDVHSGQPAQPFAVQIGEGMVIKGWDEGLIGMKAGGIRRLYIPAALAYGDQSDGPIPPNADLIFDIQLISVQ